MGYGARLAVTQLALVDFRGFTPFALSPSPTISYGKQKNDHFLNVFFVLLLLIPVLLGRILGLTGGKMSQNLQRGLAMRDFDASIEDFSNLCGFCGTDHSDPNIEWQCYAEQEAMYNGEGDHVETADDQDERKRMDIEDEPEYEDRRDYYDRDDFHYERWQDESDLLHEC